VTRTSALVVSAIHFALAPGVVVAVVPWWLTGWQAAEPMPVAWPLRVLGIATVAAATVVLVHAFARFVVEGLGTPAPVAPTERLVVGGLYRYVRNPMYVAVVAAILGQALFLGRVELLWYAIVIAAVVAVFARVYEEPALHRQFGAQSEAYRQHVPGWLPRTRPWQPGDPG
jgi:protein-S-isoprenylcysteine O-methyltransferase Ste14